MYLSGFRGNLSISGVYFVLRVSSSVDHAGNSVSWAYMVFIMFWDLLFFPSLIGFCWVVNMLIMCWDLLGQCMRLFRCIFSFWSFGITAILSFRAYRDPCCFSMHLSGFWCILLISLVHFDVCSFRCLLDVRNSFGLARRLFSVIFRMLFFSP